MEKSMNKLEKCKRKRVFWFDYVVKLNNPEINFKFRHYQRFIPSRSLTRMTSLNRCAYLALRSYYSTTTIDELLEKISYEL